MIIIVVGRIGKLCMTDDTNDDIEQRFRELEQRFRELEEQRAAGLRVPKYGARILTGRLKIPQSTLTNWLTRKIFDLDADQHRTESEARLYSTRDAILLAYAVRLTSFGMSIPAAKAIAEGLTETVVPRLFQIQNSASIDDTVMLIFSRGHEWVVALYSHEEDGKSIFSSSTGETIPADQIPDFHLTIEPRQFVLKVMETLGEPIAIGSAKDFRDAADRIDAAPIKSKRKGK
jgi:hypothetical protein